MKKIGNLLTWSVSETEHNELVSMAETHGYDLEIMYKKMMMR
jgi:hypothetical protein